MGLEAKFRIEWSTPHGKLVALEPDVEEVRRAAPVLAAAYNDPHNAPLLGHVARISEPEVLEHYRSLCEAGSHPFLLYCDDELAGDGDVRGIHDGTAEFAFLIAAPSAQGKGLGTRFAAMIHRFAFSHLRIERMYASIVPANTASRRVFEKLGYKLDTSAAAQAFADDAGDEVLSIDRSTFDRRNAAASAEIRTVARSLPARSS